jgi:hypothetical protein
VDIGHLQPGGSGSDGRQFGDPEGKVNEPEKLGALVDKGLLGGPVIGNEDGKVVGLLVGGGTDARMIGIKEVTAALAAAKVEAKRGVIDQQFEVALSRFHTNYFADAVPAFQRVLELYPGHVVAATHLKTALAKRGTAEDAGLKAAAAAEQAANSRPIWLFVVAGLVVLAGLGVLAWLLWRRRGKDDDQGGPEFEPDQRVPLPLALPPGAPGLPRPPFDEAASPTMMVRPQGFPSNPSIPSVPSGGTGQQPVLVARETSTGTHTTIGTQSQKFCTACGMRLGAAHRFCGFCGHPTEA